MYLKLMKSLRRPEDIFGSVEVDGNGNFVGKNGNYQSSGQYLNRVGMCTIE
jgi:hypothetical protein